MIKRRDFLKKLGIVCGVAVAYPTKLLGGESKPVAGIDCNKPFPWKHHYAIYDEPVSPRDLVYFENVAIPYLRNLPA